MCIINRGTRGKNEPRRFFYSNRQTKDTTKLEHVPFKRREKCLYFIDLVHRANSTKWPHFDSSKKKGQNGIRGAKMNHSSSLANFRENNRNWMLTIFPIVFRFNGYRIKQVAGSKYYLSQKYDFLKSCREDTLAKNCAFCELHANFNKSFYNSRFDLWHPNIFSKQM